MTIILNQPDKLKRAKAAWSNLSLIVLLTFAYLALIVKWYNIYFVLIVEQEAECTDPTFADKCGYGPRIEVSSVGTVFCLLSRSQVPLTHSILPICQPYKRRQLSTFNFHNIEKKNYNSTKYEIWA